MAEAGGQICNSLIVIFNLSIYFVVSFILRIPFSDRFRRCTESAVVYVGRASPFILRFVWPLICSSAGPLHR